MRRWHRSVLALITAAIAAGCGGARQCVTAVDCAPGERCVDQRCVAAGRVDGGLADAGADADEAVDAATDGGPEDAGLQPGDAARDAPGDAASPEDAGRPRPPASAIVGTIYVAQDASGARICRDATDMVAAGAGYWDLGGYASCVDGRPRCNLGSRPVMTASLGNPDGSWKGQVACVLAGPGPGSNLVATIASRGTPGGDVCLAPSDTEARAAGHWDLEAFGRCASGRPQCAGGSRRVGFAQSRDPHEAGVERYESVCVLSSGVAGARYVATAFHELRADGSGDCVVPGHRRAGEFGLWDLDDYVFCAPTGVPMCQRGARRVATAMTETHDGSLRSHVACVLPDQERGSAFVAAEKITTRRVGAVHSSECAPRSDPDVWAEVGVATCALGDLRCDGDARRMVTTERRVQVGAQHELIRHEVCVVP